ncbi:MAG: type II secretion system protein GspC [Ectothiorhodospiraceae bacterium]|nr:type II secretion system protein GspC [Ectothiorhodospiraceae bacterium]
MRYLTFLVNAVLVALLAYTLAQLFWRTVPAGDAGAAPPAPRSSAAAPQRQQQSELGARIASMQLFGPAAALDRADDVPIDAPETRLNLTLRGIFHYPQEASTLVIIAAGNRDENFYRVGDDLPGGAAIQAIYPDRVILRREGRHETLSLPQERLESGGARTAAAPAARTRQPRSDETSELQQMRERLLNNPQEFTRMMDIQPYMDGGELRGVILNPGPEPEMMEAVGLEPGDVVTAINGEPLEGPEAPMNAMRIISQASSLDLTILRDGNQTSVQVNFE